MHITEDYDLLVPILWGIFMSLLVLFILFVKIKLTPSHTNKQKTNGENFSYNVYYPSPTIKNLPAKQIEEIHSRGNITPAEYLNELESAHVCICFADDLAAWRCERFRNCHDCMVDWANMSDEHSSIWKYLKLYIDI